MANRVEISAGRGIVISKPGFDATNPALADENKVFDSSWPFSGQLVMCKLISVNVPRYSGVTTYDHMYPRDLGFYPECVLYNNVLSASTAPPAITTNIGFGAPFSGNERGHAIPPSDPSITYNLIASVMTDRIRFTAWADPSALGPPPVIRYYRFVAVVTVGAV